ncbi:MAG TPA: penicillin-binding protein 1A [Pelomicrobium sp.]|nr:penicillin-binding protein 1A [Pelomicrobium sp.]
MLRRWWFLALMALVGAGLAAGLLVAYAAVIAYPKLPSLEALTDYRPKVPLRVYSADGTLLAEYGEERRAVVSIAEVPEVLKQAILAAEDERFYQHGGVDYLGVVRAAYHNFASGGARQGASTITMQVARNFFLTKEKTFTRKFHEALLAFKIEHNLTKDQILELYINQIYLGQRAYGFAAAAQIYYGKSLPQVTLAEAAMLAGLPKAPSRFNPVANPERAKLRQLYVLRRMRELGYITEAQQQAAAAAPLVQQRSAARAEKPSGDYIAEMVRQLMVDRYGDEAYTRGFRVYTTVRDDHQRAAVEALRQGLLEYDRRHGYRGPEGYIDLRQADGKVEEFLDEALQDVDTVGDLEPAVVLQASAKEVKAYRKAGDTVTLTGDAIKFASRSLADKAPLEQRLRPGSLIRLRADAKGKPQIAQQPAAEAALVSLDPRDGAIRALVGGFDFGRSKFNHVTQAWRQPGSGFKPFIYSAALEKGFTASSVINDAPLYFDKEQTGNEEWEPKNYDEKFEGPIRLREALVKSKNLVSIRILQAIGPRYAQDFTTRFGFDAARHPPYLTLALGVGSVTPMEMAAGYGVFANGGYRIVPYFIERIEDDAGNVLARANPLRVGEGAERVVDYRNAFIMDSILRDVVIRGTGARAARLGRRDLAGKTGTTNDFIDAWFCGFHPSLVAVAWIGFDTPRSLGKGETGAQAALPMWMDYMGQVLKGVPQADFPVPEGVVAARVNPESGLLDTGSAAVVEYFLQENVPPPHEEPLFPAADGSGRSGDEIKNQLF